MKDLKDYIEESLLDGFDAIADRMDNNIFSIINRSKDSKEFDRNVDKLFELCEEPENPWKYDPKYKKSFFISRVCFAMGKPYGFVIDKIYKKTAYPIHMIIRPTWTPTGQDYTNQNVECMYFTRKKLGVDKYGNPNRDHFDSYLLYDELRVMPKDIEKQYLEFIAALPKGRVHMAAGFGKPVITGDALVKKIS